MDRAAADKRYLVYDQYNLGGPHATTQNRR